MEDIKYRSCKPEDVKEAVPLIYASGPDAFNYVFKNKNNSALDFLEYTFVTNGGEFSFDNHFAMLKNNKIIGVGSVFSSEKAKGFMLRDAIKMLKFYRLNAFAAMIRGIKIEQIIKPPVKSENSVAHIAIVEEERGHGYGQQLIDFLMQQIEKNTNSKFVLDVSEENPRAKSLYERLGFTVEKLMHSNLKSNYGFVVNHYRMVKQNI